MSLLVIQSTTRGSPETGSPPQIRPPRTCDMSTSQRLWGRPSHPCHTPACIEVTSHRECVEHAGLLRRCHESRPVPVEGRGPLIHIVEGGTKRADRPVRESAARDSCKHGQPRLYGDRSQPATRDTN